MFQELPLAQSEADLDTLEGIDAETDQIAHITVTACHVVHRAADVLTTSKGQFRPVLIEHMELSVDISSTSSRVSSGIFSP